MADSSLPVEILEVIFEDLISEYTAVAEEGELLPRWYLLPLLRVCKLWHLVCKRYLYRSISLGSKFKFPYRWVQTLVGPPTLVLTRKPHMVTYALLVKLKGNSRLAALVEELHMHWQLHYIDKVSINLLLINICPNLRHVDLRSVPSSEIDMLSGALAEKSLVSFRISILDGSKCSSLPVVDLMQRWPKIRSIRVEGGSYRTKWQEELHDSQASNAFNCCPELREIILPRNLRGKELTSLRWMCSGLAKLDVCVASSDIEALDALCGCLHAWSQTLQMLIVTAEGEPMTFSSYPPLSEALSSLTNLQELTTSNIYVDIDAISSLPQLKRLYHSTPRIDMAVNCLASHLENPEKFTALIYIAIYGYSGSNGMRNSALADVCHMRNIVLWM